MQTYEVCLGQKHSKSCGNIMDRVKSFHDACRELGVDPDHKLTISTDAKQLNPLLKNLAAGAKLMIIAKALNEGWDPDWSDSDQYKYYPWFENTGSGFSCTNYGRWDSSANVGSRLCFKSKELAIYAGKQFQDIYNEYFTI